MTQQTCVRFRRISRRLGPVAHGHDYEFCHLTASYGGVMLGHEAKFSFELTKADAKRSRDSNPEPVNPQSKASDENHGRAIWAQRHPAIADYSRFGYATIDEEGFH